LNHFNGATLVDCGVCLRHVSDLPLLFLNFLIGLFHVHRASAPESTNRRINGESFGALTNSGPIGEESEFGIEEIKLLLEVMNAFCGKQFALTWGLDWGAYDSEG
jgi:hypothetical protein